MICSCKKALSCVLIALLMLFSVSSYGAEVLTPIEKANFESYTSYQDMVQFLQDIKSSSTEMTLGSFGLSIEGKEQPYVIFSRPLITQPWEAVWSGKPIILINANVHGGEKTLRESTMLLIKELTAKDSKMNGLLENLIVIIAPSINVDGFEISTRGNVRNIDLNRDYMKLEQQELLNFVQNLILKWHPHLSVDCHNGGSYPYNITYQAGSHATPDQRITSFCDFGVFPFIDKKMADAGYKSFYYKGGDSTRWRGGRL